MVAPGSIYKNMIQHPHLITPPYHLPYSTFKSRMSFQSRDPDPSLPSCLCRLVTHALDTIWVIRDCAFTLVWQRPSCGSDEFRCNDGRCIDDFRRCDYIMDCTSGEDEANCPNISPHLCPHGEFMCGDSVCIPITTRCDGKVDCPADTSDEIGCPCQSNEWQCDSGICIDSRLRCNNRQDCPNDSSDERNCQCKDHQFRCRDGTCIDASLKCNNVTDCPNDNFDELYCRKLKKNSPEINIRALVSWRLN
uniref:Uncharacterized protein n=1 Tax=Timema douglasi TaxID=61478 RepID=A0A7R8VCB8_TIMDO|nr:unnamed protein product [Timema douglasi]